MSRALRCYGASGLSLLLSSWALDLKMLALFYLGERRGHGDMILKCPACQSDEMASFSETKVFGLLKKINLKCKSCGATFIQNGEKYLLAEISDVNNAVWHEYQKQALSEREWQNIAMGGCSDERQKILNQKQRDDDLTDWLSQLAQGQVSVDFGGIANPIILKGGEKIRLIFGNVSLMEPRAVRTGGSGGMSFRVAPGLYLRDSTFKSQSHEELKKVDQGVFVLTNQRVVFNGLNNSRDVVLERIISIEPYSDGVAFRVSGKNKTFWVSDIDNTKYTVSVNNKTYEVTFYGNKLRYLIENLIKGADNSLKFSDDSQTVSASRKKKTNETSERGKRGGEAEYFYLNRGIAYEEQGEFDRALADYTKAIEINFKNVLACLKRAYLQLKNHKYREFTLDLEKAREQVERYNNGEQWPSDWEEVFPQVDALMKQITESPILKAGVCFDKGCGLVKEDKLEEAIIEYSGAIQLDQSFLDAYNNLGEIYSEKKDFDKAISIFLRGLEINPNDFALLVNLGNAYLKKDSYEIAIEKYNTALEIDETNGAGYLNRSIAYFNLKDYNQTWLDIHKAEELGIAPPPQYLDDVRKASGRTN